MEVILQLLLIFVGGCVYMVRGGSQQLPKVPRWACALMQTFIIAPLVYVYGVNQWLLLIYPIGWYLTIMRGWGDFYDCKTWNHRFKFFLRMCESIALFLPLALIKQGFCINSAIIAFIFTVAFSLSATFVYFLYNRQTGHTDASFNWSEFATGALLAAMTFNLLGY